MVADNRPRFDPRAMHRALAERGFPTPLADKMVELVVLKEHFIRRVQAAEAPGATEQDRAMGNEALNLGAMFALEIAYQARELFNNLASSMATEPANRFRKDFQEAVNGRTAAEASRDRLIMPNEGMPGAAP